MSIKINITGSWDYNNCAKVLSSNMFPIRAAIDGYLHKFIIEAGLIKNVYVCSKNIVLNGSIEKKFNKEY